MIAKSLSNVKYERCIRLNTIFKIDVFYKQINQNVSNLFSASCIIRDSFVNVCFPIVS